MTKDVIANNARDREFPNLFTAHRSPRSKKQDILYIIEKAFPS